MAISDVWVGATALKGGAEGETLVIKNGIYDTAYGVVVLNAEMSVSSITTVKSAGEILDLAKGGAILFLNAVSENGAASMPVTSIELSSSTYTAYALFFDGTSITGTSSSADDPIVFTIGS